MMMDHTSIHIGVATTVRPKLRASKNGKVLRPTPQYVRMAEAAHQHGATLSLFHPHEIDFENHRVHAWIPSTPTATTGGWVKRFIRLPDVVYENVFVHLAVKGYTSSLRREAQKRGIPLFNPVLPGKWRMVEVLKQAGLVDLTPPTERLQDIKHLENRLRQWETVYVKPVGGYGGMDVNRIERLAEGRYRVSADRTQSSNVKIRRTLNRAELEAWVAKRRYRSHLVQRGLKLIQVGDRKMDFRVVLHRDERGEWQLIGIVPKTVARDGVVTNVIAGGQIANVESLATAARQQGKQIPLDVLEQKSKQIAELLSKRFPNVGLVGFDMAVEENAAVSMIEMNPKPARSLLSKPMLERLAVHTVGFSIFLAGRKRA
jgi:glutathione synthase/RimK-type ligase-like ATP-grasp enzyme